MDAPMLRRMERWARAAGRTWPDRPADGAGETVALVVPKLVRMQEPAVEEDAEPRGPQSIFTAPEQRGLLGSQLQ